MLNRFECIGNLGKDPEIRDLNNNNKVCNLSIGVTEKWKNKATGEQQSKTEWVKAVIFSEGLIRVCSQYLKKGSKVYLSGKLQTRKWQSNGETKYATEIVLNGFGDQVIMLDSRGNSVQEQAVVEPALDDEIPF
jgi:single-strand DNA-binding protein